MHLRLQARRTFGAFPQPSGWLRHAQRTLATWLGNEKSKPVLGDVPPAVGTGGGTSPTSQALRDVGHAGAMSHLMDQPRRAMRRTTIAAHELIDDALWLQQLRTAEALDVPVWQRGCAANAARREHLGKARDVTAGRPLGAQHQRPARRQLS